MATGTGTGTPASSASSLTLNGVRDRVRTQIENAAGFPEPLAVAVSSETLATLRDRVELHLQDSANARWTAGDIDEAILKALEEYNKISPAYAVGSITLAAAGREISLSTLTGLIRVLKVWWPYDSADPGYPPNWCQFDVYPGSILFIDERSEPASGDVVRVWYTKACTLNGLASASATTVPSEDITYIINGACYFAAKARIAEISESLTVDDETTDRLAKFADDHGKAFRFGRRDEPPAWQRYAYAFNQNDIDEAIRWALARYNDIAPQETIGTITLSSDGREISLSSLSNLLRINRVWYPYDSSAPEYPPNWVPYEHWGSTLFIKAGAEPASGETVRLWYEQLHTLYGLDSAAVTTLPADAENLIVTGAVAYVAEERVLEQPGWTPPRRFQDWAQSRMTDFQEGLAAISKREATREAGVHALPALDRWDGGRW